MRPKIFFVIGGLLLAGSVSAVHNALAFSPSEVKVFNVDSSYDVSGRTQVSATLRQVGDKALFYVDDEWWVSLENHDKINGVILDLLAEFDKVIYPRLTQVYGSEWSPGIDSEMRITILITKMKEGVGGYFNTADEYPKSQAAASNEREMIYFNATYLTTSQVKGFLAHEFQHLITFYQKDKLKNASEDIWLNEARSEYAATLCGYDKIYEGSNLQRRTREFLRNPSDSLTGWDNQPEDYGSINLFMHYLVSRYGEQILTKMMKNEFVGIASINKALEEMGFSERFADIFTNWTVANYINDCQVGEGQKFCYLDPNLTYARFHLNPSISNVIAMSDGYAFSYSEEAKDWGGHWYEVLPAGSGLNLAINFSAKDSGNFKVPIILYYANGSKAVRYINLNNGRGSDIVLNFGSSVKSIVLAPSSQTRLNSFSTSGAAYPFSFTATVTSAVAVFSPAVVSPVPTPAPSPVPVISATPPPAYPDGSLIRARGEQRVYVISGQYKRWIQSPEIFSAYPHFGWQNIIEVTPQERDWYKDAWLARAAGDYKVYEINGDLTKHWLNMTAQAFAQSGRSWDMVFTVNQAERDLYHTGAEVLK